MKLKYRKSTGLETLGMMSLFALSILIMFIGINLQVSTNSILGKIIGISVFGIGLLLNRLEKRLELEFEEY